MTERIQRVYCSLSVRMKMALISSVMILVFVSFMVSAFASGSAFSAHKPGKTSIISVSNPEVSVYVKSSEHNLSASSVSARLNGTDVGGTFEFLGRWETDYDGNTFYVIDSYKEGTITVNAGVLKDGANNVEVSIRDSAGNTFTESWSFTVAEAPKITDISPAHNSQQVSVNRVSATVTDNDTVDWTTVDLKLNSSKVAHSVDPVTGTVYYDAVLPSRSHKVDLSVRDGKGNLSTRSWTFIADKEPPAIIFLPDFSAGMTITDGQLRFSATLKDLITIKSNAQLRLNGELLGATFTYKGFYDYDGNWIISDRTEAAVEYDGAVENGEHTLTLYVEDNLGNNTTYSWAFTAATPVNNPPYVTGRSPAANAVVNISNPVITLSVKDDEDNLSQQSVRAKLNGQSVPATFQYKGRWVTDYDGDTFYVVDSYQEGTVTVETSGLSDCVINVEISIADAAGNTLVDTWPFTVSVPPEISEVYPADKSESTGVDKVYAVITSNGTIDWASVVFRINNSAVSFTVDEAAGTVTHARSFTDGSYNVYLEVKDTAGNACTRTWSFISDTSPPALTYLHDFTENMVITDAVLKVRIFLTDLVDIKNNAVLLLNGTPKPLRGRQTGQPENVELDVYWCFTPCDSRGNPDIIRGEYHDAHCFRVCKRPGGGS